MAMLITIRIIINLYLMKNVEKFVVSPNLLSVSCHWLKFMYKIVALALEAKTTK